MSESTLSLLLKWLQHGVHKLADVISRTLTIILNFRGKRTEVCLLGEVDEKLDVQFPCVDRSYSSSLKKQHQKF